MGLRVLMAVVAALVVLAGCTSRTGGDPDRDREKSSKLGPVDLRIPVELRPVLQTTPSGAPAPTSIPAQPESPRLTDAEGNYYVVSDPFLTIRELDGAEVSPDQSMPGKFVITLDLTEEDGAAFGEWTAEHVGEQLALVVDNEVIFAPNIMGAIPDGQVQISGGDGGYLRSDAEDVLNDITGH
jgi:preprotein translocase subunit SecD